jgi:8-oxo-dGTP pyrophosphatase MutT (NUDIX family)
LPYRPAGKGDGAPLNILLVTSRETRRWVIPKGNIPGGTAPHVAALMEAEEEAGVRGPIGASAIGSYRYRKRRRNGASMMLDVDVFPLAVTEELLAWKECGERERRWFAQADAADAVEEPDLAELIRSFRASQAGPAAGGTLAAVRRKSRIGGLLGWFRGLLRRRR